MALNLKAPETHDLRPRIIVFGVGGAGGNAVNNMIEKHLEGAEFVVANTDAQALAQSAATRKLQLGSGVTQGLGAGAKPQVGAQAAEESLEEIVDNLAGSHMCFITAGMGGGTGTGAAPVIARAAREMGILTVGVVTKPFQFEGSTRMRLAEGGIDQLQQVVDTLIVIPNQNLFRIANERTTFAEAFMMADDVLYQGVKGVTDLMVRPGLINLDFADVRAVMDEMGKAMMGTGEAEGDTRAIDAAEKAIANPLLDEVSLKGARGVLINITGGYDLTLFELDEAANRIRAEVDPEANIIVGSTLDPDMGGKMRVSVVATGIEALHQQVATPHADHQTHRPRLVDAQPAQPAPQMSPRPALQPATAHRAVEPAQAPAQAPAPAPAPRVVAAEPAPVAAPSRRADPFGEDALFDLDDGSLAAAPPRPAPAEPAREHPFLAAERAERAVASGAAPVAAAPASVASAAGQQPRPAAGEAQPRLSFNNLIHRMTGARPERKEDFPFTSEAMGREPYRRPAERPGERSADHVPPRDEEDLRMEVPAFLRRQAN
ncbi:cell division protein FtsZ [Rubrimonas sp.]|uniref:cell division protein FtsZ n=1 Tax=Rubrimonas sp. TaxID=2036015 RepID=UPI002FDEDE06